MGDLNTDKLPGPEALERQGMNYFDIANKLLIKVFLIFINLFFSLSGTNEGQVVMVRNGNIVEAHQVPGFLSNLLTPLLR